MSAAEAWAPACHRCGGELRRGWCEPCRTQHHDPQPGPQSQFLSCGADVVIYGGAAGGGKTWALLLDAIGHALEVPGWTGLVVRSTRELMKVGGGIWHEAMGVFAHSGAKYNHSELSVRWPNGSTLSFRQVLHNADLWNGPSYDWIGIEELQEISIDDLVSALTRLRSTKGLRPTLRATCNPKRGHGVVEWIRWYLRPDGYPDHEKAGVVRWFARSSSTYAFVFGDDRAEVEELAGRGTGSAQSFAFIPASLEDNPILDLTDPSYRSKLQLQGRVAEQRLLGGNWFVGGDDDGPLAQHRWEFVTAPLAPIVKRVRAWDKGATRPWPGNMDPDYTVGPLVLFDAAGRVYLNGLAACREETPARDVLIAQTARRDGHMVEQVHKQAPGDAGKDSVHHTRPLLEAGGGRVFSTLERKAKNAGRIEPMALMLELGMRNGKPVDAGNPPKPGDGPPEPRFFVLDGPGWNEGWLMQPYSDAGSHPRTLGDLVWSHLDPWPHGAHDDVADALADAVERGTSGPSRQLTPGQRAAATTYRLR